MIIMIIINDNNNDNNDNHHHHDAMGLGTSEMRACKQRYHRRDF